MRRYIAFALPIVFLLSGCAGSLVIVPRAGGAPVPASWKTGFSDLKVTATMPDGEIMNGKLTWLPPAGVVGAGFYSFGGNYGNSAAVASGTQGRYMGSLIGDKGTNMRIEIIANAFTGKGVGIGKTSDGRLFDIQK